MNVSILATIALTCIDHLVIPILDGQRVCYGEPIAMNLEIGGLAEYALALAYELNVGYTTYYAGKRSVFNAVATIADCAIEGYKSAMDASSSDLWRFQGVMLTSFEGKRRGHCKQRLG